MKELEEGKGRKEEGGGEGREVGKRREINGDEGGKEQKDGIT